jgi:hypothetical protein
LKCIDYVFFGHAIISRCFRAHLGYRCCIIGNKLAHIVCTHLLTFIRSYGAEVGEIVISIIFFIRSYGAEVGEIVISIIFFFGSSLFSDHLAGGIRRHLSAFGHALFRRHSLRRLFLRHFRGSVVGCLDGCGISHKSGDHLRRAFAVYLYLIKLCGQSIQLFLDTGLFHRFPGIA